VEKGSSNDLTHRIWIEKMMFLSDKSSTASSLHITNEMQNPKRNGKKRNLKSFTNKKGSAKRAAKATDTKTQE